MGAQTGSSSSRPQAYLIGMRRLLTAASVSLAFAVWIWLGVSADYKWAEVVKRELQTDGFTITREQRVGDLALPWTWVHAPIQLVGFQRILSQNIDGLIYGLDGYIRLVNEDRAEHAVWLRKVDCRSMRFAQISLSSTDTVFEDQQQIEDALSKVEWIAPASLEDERWQREWFDGVMKDYCP
jgi:hypothetical protein